MNGAWLVVLPWVAAIATFGVLYLVERRRKPLRTQTLAERLHAAGLLSTNELRSLALPDGLVHYTSPREPAALRALAREIAEEADRIEARHAYRGGAA